MSKAMQRVSLVTFVSLFLLVGCQGASYSRQVASPPVPPANSMPLSAAISEEVLGKWARSCALCHVSGVAGAPIIGNAQQWAPRLEKGEEELMRSVVEGINSMPPLGYCMSCEAADFRAMIGYMVGTLQ